MIQILVDDGGTIRLTQATLAGMPRSIKRVVTKAIERNIKAVLEHPK
jgi:hypothetical protein